ncbi:MAG: hypothetical protein A2666_02365 [Parcubacteria group bacterium RIFCSPHIGHO2_01_FULL_47_10b]|nr:MAG: hypothetical protein A2666_02365 [Parcubacteria group bacterium RIFCSPHIGHO2_01_FULL_47_10b]
MPPVQLQKNIKPGSLIKLIRHGQVTLPAKFRDALQLKEGDYLEAVMQGSGIMLKPTMIMGRNQAIKGLHQLLDEVQSHNTEFTQVEVARDVQAAVRTTKNKKL